MKENIQDNIELGINAAMQLIPVVGGSLSTLYFGYKQNKEFRRLEKTLIEIAEELNDKKIPNIKEHNEAELMSLIEELNDKIEKEHIEEKRKCYKNFYKKILVIPNQNTYNERKMFLEILSTMTPLQIELLNFLAIQPAPVLDNTIVNPLYSKAVILGSIAQLKNQGLIDCFTNSITIGGSGKISEKIIVSDFGKRFHQFCILDNLK